MLEYTQGNFSVRLLKHSITRTGKEAITYLLTYERFIHAEMMTYRQWSRNASSSRAIPFERMLNWTSDHPAMPLHLGRNRSGMQSGGVVGNPAHMRKMIHTLFAVTKSKLERIVDAHDPHKEIVNRYLEPWGWITVILTTGRDELMHFFHQRIDRHANPNIQRLAVNMARLYRRSEPQRLGPLDWHMPFIDDHIPHGQVEDVRDDLIWSVARSAWCSYNNPTKDATFERAKIRHDGCVNDGHMTPCEPQLQVTDDETGIVPGYTSYRSMLPGEFTPEFDFSILDTTYAERDYVV